MASGRDKFEERAIRNLQEADMWWQSFQHSVSRYRHMALYYFAHIRCLRIAQEHGFTERRLDRLRKSRDAAHDWMLMLEEEIDSVSASAISCEMASRIYFEEAEGRHIDD